MTEGEVKVEILEGLDNMQWAERIAEHFASIANEYSPLDTSNYLPTCQPYLLPK